MSATENTGAPIDTIDGPLTESEGENLFLQHFLNTDAKKKKPSAEDEGDKQEHDAPENDDQPDDDADENSAEELEDADGEDEGDEDDKGEKKDKDEEPAEKFADDDVFVKVKEGDKEHQVPIRDLKRLWGQEAALTRKSMEVAERRKAVDDELSRATLASQSLLDRAKAAFEPYSKIDFLAAAQQLSPDDYNTLRREAQSAYENMQFLEHGVTQLQQGLQAKQKTELAQAAQASLKVLTGPVEQGGIPNFSEKVYGDIRSYAIREGVPTDVLDNIVEPWAIRMMHDAMLFRKGQSKVITKKVNKTPKKVIKTSHSVDASKRGQKSSNETKAMQRLQRTGEADDAAQAFLARWEQADE